jgi:hypothetical protein
MVLFFIPAPYGRHMRKREGVIPDAWGWVMMEVPAVLVFGSTFFVGAYHETVTEMVFLLMWMAHYIQRTFVYPFLRRKSERGMPLLIVSMGFLFNILNGYLNGRYLFEFSRGYPDDWMKDWRFMIGGSLFIIGYVMNRNADRVLRKLRGTTWSVVGLTFAVWTMANLVPRAWAHHRWYQEWFSDYPSGRKALLPGIW